MQKNETDFENHIDDIVKAIGDKLERNVIANELRRYVDEYGIDNLENYTQICYLVHNH